MRYAVLIAGLAWFGIAATAAEPSGVSGTVQDASGRALQDVEVQVQSESTGARWKTRSDEAGHYSLSGLPQGRYKVTAHMPGFRTVARVGVVLDAATVMPLDFGMELLGLHEVITVVGGRDDPLDPSGSDNLTLTRRSPGTTLPTNGRDIRASFDLMPGVVVTPAAVSDAGQFTSNGQRPNASAFRVDGVSVNTGVGGSALPGSLPGASLPAMTAIGTTENLASPETTQSMEFRTSGFAPESGDRPGAEALVTTRAGSNEFHGEFFAHVRDTGWTARDWFANSRGIAFPRPSYNSIGGVYGGPLLPNHTFIFLSAEQSNLTSSGLALTAVPSMAARQSAPPALQGILNGFSLPTGRDLGDGTAEGITAMNRTAKVTSESGRIDQALGSHGNLFLRFVDAPSSSRAGFLDPNSGRLNWDTGTFGLTTGRSFGWIHDFRFNYSRTRLSAIVGDLWNVFGLAGVNAFDRPPLSEQTQGLYTVLGLTIPGLGQFVGGTMGSPRQEQWEFRDTLAKDRGRHQFRAGIDYIRQTASRDGVSSSILAVAPSLQGFIDGEPLAMTYSVMPRYGNRIHTVSLFGQDTLRAGEHLSIVYGLRWEITPPSASQILIPTYSGAWTAAGGWQNAHSGDINGAAPWPMRFGQAAPRIGIAYRLPGSDFVLRAGAGVFYDTTLGAAINPLNGAPFNSWQVPAGTTGTGASSSTGGSSLPATPSDDVQKFLLGSAPPLRLPTSYQWKLSVDRAIGSQGVASAAYLGSLGRHLLGNQAYVEPDTGILTRFVTLTQNTSNYQALQLRYTGSIGRNTYASFAYTWSHSIDDGSQDSSVFLIHPGYRLSEARGSSSFDVRQTLTAALSYRVPRSTRFGSLPDALAGWTVSGILRARTGFPVDILDSEQGLGRGFDNIGRPDRVPGEPIWISDPTVAGHRRLNPAAFRVPPNGITGTLGRNAINGNGLAQLDVSLRREFPIWRRLSTEVAVSLFNALNHPAFADPVPYLSSPWFGQSTSMQNLMLGSGAPNTGLPPLFQTGGSRSAELSFRVTF